MIFKNTMDAAMFGDNGTIVNYGYNNPETGEDGTQLTYHIKDGATKVIIRYGSPDILSEMEKMFESEYAECYC